MLKGKTVLLGVSGSIAAYKTAYLASALKKLDADVHVLMTQNATNAEINADAILMGKNGVDGVYSADPNKDSNAVKFDHLTHMDLIEKNLHVMDTTASSLSMDNHIPLVVFNLNTPGNIMKVVKGDEVGTTIEGD